MSGFNGATATPVNSNAASKQRDALSVYSKAQVDSAIQQSTAIKRVMATGGPFTTGSTVTFTISGTMPTWVCLRGRRWGYRSPLVMIDVNGDIQDDNNGFIVRDGSGDNSVAKISWKGASGNTLSMKVLSNTGGELHFDLFYT